MDQSSFEGVERVFATVAALLTGLLGLLQYFQYRTRRDKLSMVRESFDGVVESLASDVEVERLAGAILLRRFFDSRTEVGIAGIPYWKEAVNVTAAILRGQDTGNFQKLLADGLAFAPTLEGVDLQRTNLQFAYLGARSEGPPGSSRIITDLSGADFFRADLSRASLKGARARGAVFYQARMHGTVLRNADLHGANFFEADLKGARFDGARLEGANFSGALNLPPGLADRLDEQGIYVGPAAFEPPAQVSGSGSIRIFVSKPGCLDYPHQQQVAALLARLEAEGLVPQTLDRPDYPRFGVIGEVQRIMSCCAGAVIFGFRQLEVRDGTWRPGTPEEETLQNVNLPTAWNHLEAGMAAMHGLPMLVLCERGVRGGIFDVGAGEHQIYRVGADDDWNGAPFAGKFAQWCADVRERSRASQAA